MIKRCRHLVGDVWCRDCAIRLWRSPAPTIHLQSENNKKMPMCMVRHGNYVTTNSLKLVNCMRCLRALIRKLDT